MMQLAWLWLRHQSHSALALGFHGRTERNGGRTGESKGRAAPLQWGIAAIYPGQGYGQIIATDHRLIYFHENSVVDADFVDLKMDDSVELVGQTGESEKGPQASTVRPIGPLQFVDWPK